MLTVSIAILLQPGLVEGKTVLSVSEFFEKRSVAYATFWPFDFD
jgi:hypothetical protein